MTQSLRHLAFALGLSLLACQLSACATKPSAEVDDDEFMVLNPRSSSGRCGVERWAVKTGTDPQAHSVNLTPQDTTIAALGAIPAPSSLPSAGRVAPTELQTFRLTNVTLVQYKLENDSDYHLVLNDGSATLIAEIPDPACVGAGGVFAAGIAASRAAFDAKFTASGSFQTANIPVTLTGAAFFDLAHGQTGMAPNAIELHGVLGLCFGQNCGGASTPDFSLAASPPTASSAGGAVATSSIAVGAAGGFSGNVALSATGVPAGATAVFSPATIAGHGSSTLTLNPGSAAAGSYTIAVAGTSGALQHSTSVAWTISTAGTPDFSLGAAPASVASTGGAAASSAITVSAVNGFAGTVRLTVAGAPAGSNVGLSATTVSGAGTTTLTLQPGSAPSGSYTVTISGTSGAIGHSTTVAWAIAAGGGGGDTTPPVVQLKTPAAGAVVSGTITILASATDNVSVSKMELLLDGAVIGTSTSGQLSQPWDSTKVVNGAHSISARASDPSGNVGTAPAVGITVSNGTTPPPQQDLIVNGTFEGTLQGWRLGGDKLPIDSSMHAHGGRYSMRMGSTRYNEPSGESYGYQAVTIPAAATSATLSFWYFGQTYDTADYDWQEADILDTRGYVLQQIFQMADDSRSWTHQTVDLARYRGQTILVYFNVHSDGAYDSTALWVDDVSLVVNGAGGGGGDHTPPTTSVTAPADGATVSGTITLTAAASDNVGVTKVEFYADGNLLGAATGSPPSARWNTAAVADGSHALLSKAYDAAGNVGTSAPINVTVNNAGPADTTPPSTSITAPANGATVSGTVSVTAAASDNVGVTRVDFLLDGAALGSASSAPYGASWNTANTANGSHSLTSKAFDAAGNVGTSAAVTVTVNNGTGGDTTPPTTSITTPSNGSTVSSTATIAASAADNVGVVKVEFYADGALLGTDTSAPYSISWNTTSVSNGAHALSTKAYDAAGNIGASAAVNVTVNNVTAGGLHTVFVILMENHNWSSIKGSSSAPYINGTLLTQGAHAENYINLPGLHPSEPNYLWLEAGTNFGVSNDSPPSTNHQGTTQHLTSLLQGAGLSWKSYQEGISGTTCPLTNSGLYAPKHNPMVFFDDVTNNLSTSSANCIQHVRPFTELSTDLSRGTVASYNFITPNLCNDMHGASGCPSDSIATGDTWLSQVVPQIMASSAYKNGGAIFITWDESEGGDLPIGMIVLSPQAKPGYTSNVAFNHSSALRTFQEIFQVSPMLGGAANATNLGDLFQKFP